MREISNKLSLGYFLNKNDNCSNAHSGIEDIIKISKHKIMNRCAMPSWLTQHFTFITLFLPVFSLINDSYLKIKKLFKILLVRNPNFFSVRKLKSYGFWKIERNCQSFLLSCLLSCLFLNILLFHISITKTLKANYKSIPVWLQLIS